MVSLRKSTAYRSPSYSIYLTCVLLSSHCNSNRDTIELLFSTNTGNLHSSTPLFFGLNMTHLIAAVIISNKTLHVAVAAVEFGHPIDVKLLVNVTFSKRNKVLQVLESSLSLAMRTRSS